MSIGLIISPCGEYVAWTTKRLGEDQLFSGSFVVLRHISAIFRQICLEGNRFFVYLQTTKGYRYLQFPRVRSIICGQFSVTRWIIIVYGVRCENGYVRIYLNGDVISINEIDSVIGGELISGFWLIIQGEWNKEIRENGVGRWLFIWGTTYTVWEIDFMGVKSVRSIKRHCSIRELLLHLVFFNNSSAWMLFGVCHRYILTVNGAPCMLNVLGFTFTHNWKILINNTPQ